MIWYILTRWRRLIRNPSRESAENIAIVGQAYRKAIREAIGLDPDA